MSIYFSTINKVVGDRARVIVPQPDRVLINLNNSTPEVLSSEYLYMFRSRDLTKYDNCSGQNLIILEEPDFPVPQEYFKMNGLNMVIVSDETVAESIKTDILRTFDEQSKISNFAYGLMDICCQTSNVQKVLDFGYSFMNNPLIFVDTSFCLIAHSGIYTGINDSTISYCLENKRLPSKFLDSMVNETFQHTDVDFPNLIITEKDQDDKTSSKIDSVRVIRDGQLLGYLKLFEYNHEISIIEKNCLIVLAGFVALSLVDSLPRLPNAKIQIEDFLTGIFSKRLTTKEAIESRVTLYHLDSNKPMHVVSIKYDRLITSIDQLYFYKRELQSMFNTSMITFFNQLVILVVTDDVLEAQYQAFGSFLKSHHLNAGISLKFNSFLNLYKYYAQTLACLEIKSYYSLEDSIIDYNQWNLVHMFLNFQDYCSLDELIPEDVRILQEIDHAKGSNLTETLFSFVHNRQDITNSAAEMHLHYNTMKYRINRIQELTNIEFHDPQCVYRIIIAEKVMQIMQKIPPSNSYKG